jgi:hypothetical protein
MPAVEEWQLGIGIGGLVLAGVAATFAGLDWWRGRRLWRIDYRTSRRNKDHEPMKRPDAVYLVVTVKCRRNRIRVESIGLAGDRRAPLAPAIAFQDSRHQAMLDEGDEARALFLSDHVAAHHASKRLREACWYDPDGKAHCRPIPPNILRAVLADGRL